MTIHPDVSGRPHVLLMHERIIEHINKHEGVRWVTMAEASLQYPKVDAGFSVANLSIDGRPFQEQEHTRSGSSDAG